MAVFNLPVFQIPFRSLSTLSDSTERQVALGLLHTPTGLKYGKDCPENKIGEPLRYPLRSGLLGQDAIRMTRRRTWGELCEIGNSGDFAGTDLELSNATDV